MHLSSPQPTEPSKSAFDPLDLEIIEQVYDAVWDAVRVNDPFRNLRLDDELKASIRRVLFACAAIQGTNDPDGLKEAVLSTLKSPSGSDK